MLQLLANGNQLDTSGVKFNLTLKNPMFLNKLEGSYSYNIQFPLTKGNKRNLINFTHRPESANEIIKPNISAFYSGLNLFNGPFIFSKLNSKISGSIVTGDGEFLNKIHSMYLDEIDYGSKSFVDEAAALTYFNSIVDKYYPEVDWVLPHIKSYQTDSFLPSGTTGYYEKDTINKWDPATSTYTITSGADKAIISPQLFLLYVLNTVFHHFGYSFIDNFFANDAEYEKLYLSNIFNANGGIPTIDGHPGYDSDILDINLTNHVPHILISDLLVGLQNFINVRFKFNHINKTVIAYDALKAIKSTDYVDFTAKALNFYEMEPQIFNGFELALKSDDKDLHHKEYIDQENDYFDNYGGFVETVDDLPTKPTGCKLFYIVAEEEFYSWTVLLGWRSTSSPFFSKFFIPSNEFSIVSPVSGLKQDAGLTVAPSIGYPANEYRNMLGRISFYNGLKQYASSGDYYPSSAEILNDKYLNHRAGALYNARWKDYLDLVLNKPIVNFKMQLSPIDIKNFDFSKKHRINGIDYLIKEVKIPIEEKRILPATLECYKV